MFSLISEVCQSAKADLQISGFEVVRATDIVSPGVIHYEIWDEIRKADIVIADVTGYNPNVIFELGVAAAVKGKQRVILLREEGEQHDDFPFDTMPARHITYARTHRGLQELAVKLHHMVVQSLVGAPFEEIPYQEAEPQLPFSALQRGGYECPSIWTSDLSHRRMLHDCLEFGSLYVPRYSWASIGNLRLANLRVRAEMKITLLGERPEKDEWIGISVRDQGFYANFGWLVHVRRNGEVAFTMVKSERFDMDVPAIGRVKALDDRSGSEFVEFVIAVTDRQLSVRVDECHWEIPLGQLPYVFTRGRILFKTAYARAGLRHVYVEAPDTA